ncbi:MAG: class I SAM-dependent methyltransferase [Lachnospiraceae bacterium]|nr:class I SAM-dependent methyltransferase [Lachnospiraceae bacterium]
MTGRLYGKSVGEVLKIKNDFFEQNGKMLELSAHQADVLLAQPLRKKCKICGCALPDETMYSSQRMEYLVCPECGHVNSRHEDTEAFARAVYLEDPYEHHYSEADREAYLKRMRTIYIPKAEFLLETLEGEGLNKDGIRILDDGAGSGYFVRACQELGLTALGIEISEAQVQFANEMAGTDILKTVPGEEIPAFLSVAEFNVFSFIGVLEHIVNLQEVTEAIRDNENVQYVYLSVPMISLSCVLEAANQDCYNRHAGGTHTHLFTDSSIERMAENMGFTVHRTWKFGSDMMDLFRMLCVKLDEGGNRSMKEYFSPKFLSMIDELQEVVDRHEFASEIHAILKRADLK